MPDVTWPFNETAESRFWLKVDVRGPEECWPWVGGMRGRYGWFRPGGADTRPGPASRCAWALVHGVWPTRMEFVCHTCDNPPCCNPKHLYLGSPAENTADMMARGRAPYGERNGSARYTAEQICAIRDLYSTGRYQHADVGRIFNLPPRTVGYIVRRDCWTHME